MSSEPGASGSWFRQRAADAASAAKAVGGLPVFKGPWVPVVAGYLFTFYNGKKSEERKAQIERTNDQVRLLYGPLFACTNATRSAYAAMARQHSPDGTVEGFVHAVRADPESPEAHAYRHWMTDVIQPLNDRACQVIMNHTDLLETATMDDLLLQFVAHVSAYRVIVAMWKQGQHGEWSAISYPNELPDHVERAFRRIKRRQAELLGTRPGTVSRRVRHLGAVLASVASGRAFRETASARSPSGVVAVSRAAAVVPRSRL